jgi:RNA polymerase sigma-70 factor, ECF subfamily
LQRFQGRSAFSTWLTRIAINESLMFLRRVRAKREVPMDDPSHEEAERHSDVADAAPDPEAAYILQENAEILNNVFRQLSNRTRRALELSELRELSLSETAQWMGISIGAVKARVFHGRRKLRTMLRRCMSLPSMSERAASTLSRNTCFVSQNRLACDAGD